ncbi:MFS general substrate transporter [Trametes versicolor FP-101664 SS1]|uniref:MFS general substrate transporter n=1 Tax=Trametes versicolor (strain FP-101664) TaxID=717944 RepID=UPI0004621764|nr:MFS general substrate transporter [Trametes versicolor FP-101664 SS1]EIW58339.1 MFS general substrate transporter [Trametes versicolor FP-101664 SS1]
MKPTDEESTIVEDVVVTETGSLARRSLASVHDAVDPRIRPSDRPTDDVLDEGYARQLSDYIGHKHHHEKSPSEKEGSQKDSDEPIYVEFEEVDSRDPMNFSYTRKWLITFTASFFSIIVASSSSAYALGVPSMIRDLNATQFQATIGLSMYTLGFAIVPLVSASFSEEFGRQPLYFCSGVGCLLMHLMIALAPNIQTVIVGRFLAGAFGSTGSTMVGGTIADIWAPHERGMPMSLFAIMALTGPGIGCVASGWIEQDPRLEWRWIQWIHVIWTGIFVIAVPICMKETRSGVLLTRLAKKLRKDTGNHHYRARVEDERASLRTLIYISCTRPIYLLITEPVVAAFSLWVGFAWGILYVLVESIAPAFRTIHHFNTGQTGTVFATMIVGCFAGLAIQLYQEKLYTKHAPKRGPEARLFSACLGAVLFPAGIFIYAWSTFESVHWMGMAMGVFVIMTALFVLYVAVFTYLADCYGIFASSALAGQSLCRNLMGMAFPLFTEQMFARLTYHWGNTLFGCIAIAMIPIPFVLMWKGPVIRASSKFASQTVHKF